MLPGNSHPSVRRSRGLGTVLVHAVTVRGSFFERLLFMNFKSIDNLEAVVLQRTALHIGVDLVTMSPWSV